MVFIDARLPVRFGPIEDRAADEAVLTDCDVAAVPPVARFAAAAPGHAPDCLCCTPRSAAATSLAALFRDRVLLPGRPFRGVLAVVGAAGEQAVRTALTDDAFASGRYRLA